MIGAMDFTGDLFICFYEKNSVQAFRFFFVCVRSREYSNVDNAHDQFLTVSVTLNSGRCLL